MEKKMKHEEIMEELEKEFGPVFRNSPDGVYLWLDENHMVCNEKLAKMFGYSVAEIRAKAPFLDNFVAEDDQEFFSLNYHRTVPALSFPTTFRFRGKRKNGNLFLAETDMIPLSWHGHPIAYHFVREIEA